MWPVEASGELITGVVISGIGGISGRVGLLNVLVVRWLAAVPQGTEVSIHTPPPLFAKPLQTRRSEC